MPKAVLIGALGLAVALATLRRPGGSSGDTRTLGTHALLLAGALAGALRAGFLGAGLPVLLTAAGCGALALGARSARVPFARIALPTLGAALALGGYGLLQLAGADPLPWNPADRVGRTALCATLGNVNWLGAWLALAAPLLFAGFRSSSGARRAGYGLALALALGLTLATRSRAALLAVGCALLFLWLRHPGSRRRKALVLAALALAFLAADGAIRLGGGYPLTARLANAGQALDDRLFLWRRTLEMAGETGLTGGGPGRFAYLYPDRVATFHGIAPPIAAAGFARHAHDDFLQVYVELGAAGLAAFVALLGLGLARACRSEAPLSACAGATLAAALPLALFDTVLYHPALWLLVTFAAAYADGGGAGGAAPAGADRPGYPRLFAVFLGLPLLALLIAGGFALAGSAAQALGNHALARGERSAARSAFETAARRFPWNGEASYLAGALALEAGEPVPAAVLLGRAARQIREPGLDFDLGLAWERGGFGTGPERFRRALRHYRRASALAPGDLSGTLAGAFSRLGADREAESAFLRWQAACDAADTLDLAAVPLLDRLIARRLADPAPVLYELLAQRARYAVAARIGAP